MDYEYFHQICPGLRLTYSKDCRKCWLVLDYVKQEEEFVRKLYVLYNPDDKRGNT